MLRLMPHFATSYLGAGYVHWSNTLSHHNDEAHLRGYLCTPQSKAKAKGSDSPHHLRLKRLASAITATLLLGCSLAIAPAQALSLDSTRNVANTAPRAAEAPRDPAKAASAESVQTDADASASTPAPSASVQAGELSNEPPAASVFTPPSGAEASYDELHLQRSIESTPDSSLPPASAVATAPAPAEADVSSAGAEAILLPSEEMASTLSAHVLRREEIREKTTKCEAGRDMEACNDLGMHYLILAIDHGLDIELNMRLASHNLEQACAGGIQSACGFWANALGMYGNYFITELNPNPNYARGKMLLEQSCEQKDPYGCAQLGTLYVEGKGVAQNVTQGLQLFALSCKLAAALPEEISQVDNNVGIGCFYLGRSYLNNQTLDPHGDVAISYLNQACNLHAAPACSTLADYYQQQGAMDSAHLFREKACYTGMTEECVNEAVFHHHVGNEAEANRLLQVGCELNNDNACTLLASNMLYGIGMEQNVPQALTLVRRSCDHNSPLACFYLAQLYHTGISNVEGYRLARNLNIAHDLYLKACNFGNDLACMELNKLDQLFPPHVDSNPNSEHPIPTMGTSLNGSKAISNLNRQDNQNSIAPSRPNQGNSTSLVPNAPRAPDAAAPESAPAIYPAP